MVLTITINALETKTKDPIGSVLAQCQNDIRSLLVTGPRVGPYFDDDVTRGK
jgi:hypothetical protein